MMDKHSKKIHKLSIFIFRRDLRLDDNTGLFHALRLSEVVIPCFIFDINQIDETKNPYFSHNVVQFMIESLKDLNSQLAKHKSRLFFFHGEIENTFKHILNEFQPNAVFINEDVTPYAMKRDNKFKEVCEDRDLKFYSFSDTMLIAKDKILLSGGRFYQKFTPYYKNAMTFPVNEPEPNTFKNYYLSSEQVKGEYKFEDIDKFYTENKEIEIHGGRTEALKVIKGIHQFKNYKDIRDYPALSTSKLSAHNKFGTASIREVYYAAKEEFGVSCTFIQQLFWRDFYYNIAFHYPHVFGIYSFYASDLSNYFYRKSYESKVRDCRI